MMTTTYQQLVLMKRMAWRNIQPRHTPTASDEKYVPMAIAMLSYLGALDFAMIDLQGELENAGQFQHEIKRRITQAYDITRVAHSVAYKALLSVDAKSVAQYDSCFMYTYDQIQQCVMLSGIERAYNIVLSLCRLVEKYNKLLSGRYDFAPARLIYKIPNLLHCVGVEDYELDAIIELNTK